MDQQPTVSNDNENSSFHSTRNELTKLYINLNNFKYTVRFNKMSNSCTHFIY